MTSEDRFRIPFIVRVPVYFSASHGHPRKTPSTPQLSPSDRVWQLTSTFYKDPNINHSYNLNFFLPDLKTMDFVNPYAAGG